MLVVIITVPTADNFSQINSIEKEYTENVIFSKSLPRKMYIQVFLQLMIKAFEKYSHITEEIIIQSIQKNANDLVKAL